MSYYVDSESEQVIELGTKAYPFKELSYVFLEVLNFHSHSDRNITVYVKEGTTNYLSINNNYVVNVTQVSFETFSDDDSETPAKATIIGVDSSPIVPHPGTQFSIVEDYIPNIDEMVWNNSDISETEKSIIKSSSSLIFAVRSSVIINNFEIHSSYNVNANMNTFIYPVYIQKKKITIKNCKIKVQGAALLASDPISLYIENVDIDLDRSSGGITIVVYCGYPEAALDGIISIKNLNIHYSSEREVYPYIYYIFRYTGPASFDVSNIIISTHLFEQENNPTFYFVPSPTCVPDYAQRVHNFSDVFITPGPETGERSLFISNYVSDLYVKNVYYFQNIHVSSTAEKFMVFYLVGYYTSELYINGITMKDSSVPRVLFYTNLFDKLEMTNIIVENTSLVYYIMFDINYANSVKLSNVNVNNFTVSSDEAGRLFHINTLPYAKFEMKDWTMANCDFEAHDMIYFNPVQTGALIANNINFDNAKIDSTILKTGSLYSFQITNSTFKGITKYDANDESNVMIYISLIGLFEYGVYIMNNITIEDSIVTFFKMSDLSDANVEGKKLTISSLQFTNTYSEYGFDMISIGHMETDRDFEIVLSDIKASNLTFINTGNLFKFNQQTAKPLILKDCYFHDLRGVNIHLESFNPANTDLLTNIKMVNITAENASSGTKSFLLNNEGGYLEIYNSSFANMDNIERGAVVTGGYQNSQTLIYNSTFTNNTSIYGGVAYVHSGSVIKFYDCELINNFAVQSGVIQVSDDGSFEFYNSTIRDNYAYTVPISEVFISSPTSLISSSTISNNEALTSDYIIAQLDKCTDL